MFPKVTSIVGEDRWLGGRRQEQVFFWQNMGGGGGQMGGGTGGKNLNFGQGVPE